MANALSGIPFLSGYQAQTDANQQQGVQQLAQAGSLMQILGQMQAQAEKQKAAQREAAFTAELQGLGPNPTQEQLAQVGARHVRDPKALMEGQQKSLDRKTLSEDRVSIANENRAQMALQFSQNLDMRQQALEQRKTEFDQRVTDGAARQQFEQWYKTESLKNQQAQNNIANQMRMMGFEIQRQGQQLQIARIDQATEQNVDRQVTQFANELQQQKIPALAASITTANDLLKQYEGKDIPGFGIIEGSSKIPSMVRGSEANKVRSAVQGVTNDLLNLYSGLAVTLPESERRELEQMIGGNFTDIDFKTTWPRIVNRFNTVLGNMGASASPKAVERYKSRPGAMKLDAVAPAFGAKAGPQVGDVVDGYKFKGGNPAAKANWEKQ